MALALLLAALAAQVTPIQPLPKGTALPPPGTDEAAVMAPVAALLAGIAAHDGAAATARTLPGGGATAVVERADGVREVRHRSWTEFAAALKPGSDRVEERLTDPAIEVDGDIAMVWSPYVFVVNGAVHHCGTDHFDLVRDAGGWKIFNVTWSQRTTGCVS